MKKCIRIMSVTLMAMAVFWIAAAVMDYVVMGAGSLWEWIIADIPRRSLISRLLGMAIIGLATLALGLILCRRWVRGYEHTEEGCRAILDDINDAVFIHDIETARVIDVNRRACEMYGYEAEEMCTMDVGALSSSNEPYTTEFARRWMRKALTEGPQVFEWLARDKHGKLFWTEVSLKTVVVYGAARVLAIVRDITKHKIAEEACEENERKYRTAFNVSPVAIGLIGKDGRIIEVNGRLSEWLGLDMAELMGCSIRDLPFGSDADRGRMIGAFEDRTHGSNVAPYEVTFVGKNGRGVVCEIHAEAMRNSRGEIICEMVMVVDISARREAERAVIESEKKYHAVFEASPAAIVMLDTKGFVLDVNSRVQEWLGFALDEIRGRHLLRIPALTMTNRIRAFKALLKRMQGHDVPPYELEFVTKSGQSRIGLIRATDLHDERGRIAGDLVLISDITESRRAEDALRQSEENYRRLFEESNDAIFIHDLKGHISDVNAAACTMLGYSRNELLNLSIAKLHPQDQLGESARAFEMVRRKGTVRFESKFMRADGRTIDVDISSCLVDPDNEVVQGVVRDITVRRREEEKLKDALEFKSEILTNVSHELGVPLAHMMGFINLTLKEDDGRLSSSGKDFLQRAQRNARQLMTLIGNLLDASRIDAGRIRLTRESFSLAGVITDCIENMESMMVDRPITLVKHMDKRDVQMFSDRAKIEAVVTNLVSNAIKFTEKGEVSVEAGIADDRPGWLRIRVKDTGIGIPQHKKKRVFEKFMQLHGGETHRYQGAGLGLYVVKQYVDLLGGEIDIISQPGAGTTVTVLLPTSISESDESSSGDGAS